MFLAIIFHRQEKHRVIIPLHRDKANSPDKLYNLQAVYNLTNSHWNQFLGNGKHIFRSDIIRNGAVLSSQTDSTNIIQFGTQNFTLNY